MLIIAIFFVINDINFKEELWEQILNTEESFAVLNKIPPKGEINLTKTFKMKAKSH